MAECKNVSITGNLIEANDHSGIFAEFLYYGSKSITVNKNVIHFNAGYAIESYAVKDLKVEQNKIVGNGNNSEQQKLSDEKMIVMDGMKQQAQKTL